jgi:hypothetical protein
MTQYRQENTGELYDDDEIENYFYNDIANLSAEQREEISFEGWLEEMLSWGRFEIVDDDDDEGIGEADS